MYLEEVGRIAPSLALCSLLRGVFRVVVRIVAVFLARSSLAGSSLCLFASRGRQLQPGNLPLLEIRARIHEDVALQALGGSMLLGEAVVRVVADTDLLAKLADFHAAVLNQPGNLAPDLIRVLRDGHAFDIDFGEVDVFLFDI